MSFQATKREWSELYSFFRLLADGYVCAGTPNALSNDSEVYRVALVQREEHDGPRRYIIEPDEIHILGENMDKHIPREDFATIALLVLNMLMKAGGEEELESPAGIEEFLDAIAIYDLEAKTNDRTDFHIAFWSVDAPLIGFRSYSRLGGMLPLLDGGRTANIKLEQTGVRFPNPTVNKINSLESSNEVLDRMIMIENLGGTFKYSDVADKVFRSNLLMIDLHFPRMMAEMLRIMYYEGITRIADLTEQLKEKNPLKIKDELIKKHGFYEYKIKQFLMALALGMRPAKLYNGTDSAVAGFIYTDAEGNIMCYHKGEKEIFQDFLFKNTRLEKGSTTKDKYGYLERENNLYYFKLNLKIGFAKKK